MLIHGRLILTAHSFMLDEVRSLLQKALRRKDRALVLGATRELLGYRKDQLPWKPLVTFLFEDHCLSQAEVVRSMVRCHQQKDKYRAVELLLQCHTARVAACVPVITLDPEYEPKNWDPELEIPAKYRGLLTVSPGQINGGRLIAHLVKAWQNKHETDMMTYFKMATMVEDVMQSQVTGKGEKMLIESVKKPQPTHVFLSVLHQETSDLDTKKYIAACYKLSAIPDVCLRLVLCSVLTHVVFPQRANTTDEIKLGDVKWETVQVLDHMPSWAVDKHTFRGKHGKGTKHLVKKCPKDMSEDQFEEFHGERPKSGLKEFFEAGCVCQKSALEVNPYWERTKEIYYSKPHKLQKTAHMTKVYYAEMLAKYPHIKVKALKPSTATELEMCDEMKPGTNKRTRTSVDAAKRTKLDVEASTSEHQGTKTQSSTQAESSTETKQSSIKAETPSTGQSSDTNTKRVVNKKSSKDAAQTVHYDSLNLPGPLLQLPTGSAKLYTCANLATKEVIKGPYSEKKLAMTRFFHEAMRNSLGDVHTMEIEVDGRYIMFELLRDQEAEIKATAKDFYDAISKQNIVNGHFLTRETLGIVQGHRMPISALHNVPMTFWVHYVYRACLNVGDSGLYNSVTDSRQSFLYGIDMEEQRKTVQSRSLLDIMFVKKPAKAYSEAITITIKANKKAMMKLLDREVNYEELQDLANARQYRDFDADLFKQRLKNTKYAVEKL